MKTTIRLDGEEALINFIEWMEAIRECMGDNAVVSFQSVGGRASMLIEEEE